MFRFQLTYIDTVTVDEPNGFSSLSSVLRRDFDSSGAIFQLTESDLKLEFAGQGRTVFEGARDAEGYDAVVTISIDEREDQFSDWTNIYVGQAIMENLEIDQDYAKVDFEEISLLKRITDRLNVPVESEATEDLDGNAINAATTVTISTPGRPILKESSGGTTEPIQRMDLVNDVWTYLSSGSFSNPAIINEPNLKEIKNQIIYFDEGKAFQETQYSINSNTELYLGGQLVLQYEAIEYTATISVNGRILIRDLNVGGGSTGDVDFYLRRLDGSNTTVDDRLIASWDMSDTKYDSNNDSAIEVIDFEVEDIIDDTYTYVLWLDSLSQTNTNRFTFGFNVSFLPVSAINFFDPLVLSTTANTKARSSTTTSTFIHEAIRHNIEVISGDSTALDAPYIGRSADGYDSDGCASQYVEFNGAQHRTVDRSPFSSLADRLESLISIFNLGWGMEQVYGGEDFKIKIAPREYFYQDVLLESFNEIEQESYNEQFFDWFSYSSVNVGYKTYTGGNNDFPGTLDDFNTETTYSVPISRIGDDTKVFKANYVASDILMEVTRREQFKNNPTNSWKYDDSLFICEVKDIYDSGTFSQGSRFQIGNVGIDYGGFSPINFTINPRFNFYNLFSILNSQLYRKPIDAVYRNTDYRINGDERIYYSGDSDIPCLGDTMVYNSGTAPELQQDNDAPFSGVRLFDPIKITFRNKISIEQRNRIVDAHRNNLASGNYGYINVTNPDGDVISGWLLEMAFNIVDKIATFELIKKADNYEL